jgi:hypothetical protein
MRQLAPGGLAMSAALRSADPDAIAHWAASTRAGAGVLRAARARLEGLCAAMPVGIWRSAAAGVFVNAGHEQGQRLDLVATLFEQLASVGGELASALAAAQSQARYAAGRGGRVDAEVQAFNDRIRAQHALRPQDPDSLLADGPEAQGLQWQLASVAGDLADAEAAASRAWQRATAGFDEVSYATPGMRRRMADSAWDPAAEVRSAGSAVTAACGPMEELGLPVGGMLTGPDGRSYPLIVQTATGEGGKPFVTARGSQDGDGWTTLAVRVGTTSYGPKASGWEKLAVALGGAAGAQYPEGTSFAPGLLGEVRIMGDGGAYLSPQGRGDLDSVKEALAAPEHNYLSEYWVAPTSGIAAGRRSVLAERVALLANVLGGLAAAVHLDDGRAADYRVVFEENASGSLRARLQLYRVLNVPGEEPRVLTGSGYVDSSGRLASVQATGDAPDAPPIMVPAGG